MLDKIIEIYSEYHITKIGIGLIVLAAIITLTLRTVCGDWRWKKYESTKSSKKGRPHRKCLSEER